MFVAGDKIKLKRSRSDRVYLVVDADPTIPRPASNSRRGAVIPVVLDTWVDKSVPIFMYSNDFEKVK